MRNFFLTVFFCSLFFGNGFAATLPPAVSAALKHARIPLSSVAIVVQEEHGNAPILNLNGQQAMNPASTMKLLTTFAALETLGPAYRWKTEAYLDGKLEKGVLQGDLVFKGYGDPKLTIEQFWMWLRELRQRGLRDIRGNLVLDHSFFETVHNDPAEFDHDPSRAYNVGTNALLLNFNAMHLHLIPDGHNTIALLEPPLAGYALRNHITTTATLDCHGKDAYQARLDGHDIVLEGTIPEICGETDDYFALLPQDEYFFAVFSALWQELGGTIQGTLHSGIVSSDQTPFAKYISPPLSEVIRDINKFSNNTSASGITKTLLPTENKNQGGDLSRLQIPTEPALTVASEGESADADLTTALDASAPSFPAENNPKADTVPINKLDMEPPVASILPPQSYPPGANIAGSITAMQQWLKTQHLQFPELVLENGAGLSRKERISALHLAELLQHATRSPFYAELAASLPILGMDGTVKKRFKDNGIAGYAHLKTGSLQGVKSIAGYVKARSGKQWVMVFIVNHPNAALAPAAQDALIEWLQTTH
jgi:D-alanyl-D-alanine carboxypeptidase/D-alanyl-D-alanine-endopeptidase (penicillin-binding protein 4)